MDTSKQIERLAYRVGEFAEAVGISRSKAYEEIAAGHVPVIRIGTSIRIPVDGARQWMTALATREAGK